MSVFAALRIINFTIWMSVLLAFASSAVNRAATNRGRRGLLSAETSSTTAVAAHRRSQPEAAVPAAWLVSHSGCEGELQQYDRNVRTQLDTDSAKVSHDNCFVNRQQRRMSPRVSSTLSNGTNGWQKNPQYFAVILLSPWLVVACHDVSVLVRFLFDSRSRLSFYLQMKMTQ